MARLKDKVAVVTGGGRGIGEAICRTFAAEGAFVAVTDVHHDDADRAATAITGDGGRAAAWSFNVTDAAAVADAADQIEERFGAIDIWVNNAGVSTIVPFLECSEATWDKTLAVNLTGAFIGSQTALRRMVPRRRGVVLNMSSQSGKVGNSHYAAYCASKFGVIGLTQSLAVEFARDGVRVNALCPGVVFTPLWDEQIADYARKRTMEIGEVRGYLEGKIPMGRACTPEDVAQVALFLAGDEAAYITGEAVNISGGSVMH